MNAPLRFAVIHHRSDMRSARNKMNVAIYEALLDTISSPIVFVDNDHVIRYLNKAAKVRYYEKRGYSDLIGKSLFECHNAESEKMTKQIYDTLLSGENEVFLKMSDDNQKVTVIAVRDPAGKLIGYYERFE
jgi:DUF438 domain-containing protein